jgi:hypothetical protein
VFHEKPEGKGLPTLEKVAAPAILFEWNFEKGNTL